MVLQDNMKFNWNLHRMGNILSSKNNRICPDLINYCFFNPQYADGHGALLHICYSELRSRKLTNENSLAGMSYERSSTKSRSKTSAVTTRIEDMKKLHGAIISKTQLEVINIDLSFHMKFRSESF